MPESPAKPWPTGCKTCNPIPERRPATLLLLLLLPLLLLWPAPTTAMEAQQEQWRQLLLKTLAEKGGKAELAVEEAHLREKKGQVELRFILRQRQEPPMALEIPLLIVTPRQSFTTTISSHRAETAIKLELPDRPTEIRLDPYQELPRRLDHAETSPSWAGFLAAKQRLAIIPEEPPEAWQPLLELLARLNIDTLPLSRLENAELVNSALLFAGSEQENPGRGFFATPPRSTSDHPELQARQNPLNPEKTAILLHLHSKPTAADLEALLSALDSPGLFSKLRVENGKARTEITPPPLQGLQVLLDQPPDGIAAPARRGFHEIMAELADTRVIYVGEVHNRYEDHLLQLRVLRAMHRQNPMVAVAMEMFPVSAQPALDAYLAGELDEPEFLRQSEYFTNWSFDYRLYREIIDFARRHELPIVALNLERGITGKVFREGGTAALEPEELELIPPDRDLALPGFRRRIGAAFAMHDSDPQQELERFSGFLQAQSLWDEQMAARMAEFLVANPDYRLLAVVGQGHSDKRNAIPPRLARRLPVSQKVILPVREQTAQADAADYFFFIQQQNLPDQALLGVRVRDGEEEAGAVVAGLSPHGKAREAGIKEGDLIISLDAWKIADANDLRIAMLYQNQGETVKVRVLRPPAPPATEEEPPPTATDPETLEFAIEL